MFHGCQLGKYFGFLWNIILIMENLRINFMNSQVIIKFANSSSLEITVYTIFFSYSL